MTSGVPQGSVVGLAVFNNFVNDGRKGSNISSQIFCKSTISFSVLRQMYENKRDRQQL